MSGNEAAVRLRRAITASIRAMTRFWDSDDGDAEALAEAMTELRRNGQRYLRAALATERRLTVERVRAALQPRKERIGGDPAYNLSELDLILQDILDDLATADVDEEAGK